MAQWRKVTELSGSNQEIQKRLLLIYRQNKFPISIRGTLADTIEEVDWLSINTQSLDFTMRSAQMHFDSLMTAMDHKIKQFNHEFNKKLQLQEEKQRLNDLFSSDVVEFVIVMQKCMKEERLLIDSCHYDVDDHRPKEERAQQNPVLLRKIGEFEHILNQAEGELKQFADHQANFRIEYTTYSEEIDRLNEKMHQQRNEVEKQITEKEVKRFEKDRAKKAKKNYEERTNVGRKQEILARELNDLIQEVWKEIDTWKNQNKRSFSGLEKPKEGALDILDNMCLRVNAFLLQLLNQLDKTLTVFNDLKYESPGSPDEWIPKIIDVKTRVETILNKHLARIFLVDKCPRILKVICAKSLGFTMTCRLLGGHALNLQTTPNVTAELHKEQEVVNAIRSYNKRGICEIVNGQERPMDFLRTSKQYIGNFNSVQLQKVKQLDKSSDKLVMENRFAMVFYTQLQIRDKGYSLAAYSPPMALISHVLQDCMARAFLIWDAAFSKPDSERIPFEHPQEVAWERVAKVLDALFKENTGRGLTKEQLDYLGKVAFRDKKVSNNDKRMISKSLLIKDRLHKDFSFWKWFYANMNLIRERLREEWKDGVIHGFISKEEIMDKLKQCKPGTFMLRFSERSIENSSRADICGCLTLAVVEIDPETEVNKIYHVKEHLSPKDIFDRGLGMTLEAFEVRDFRTQNKRPLLTFLYPDQEFSKAFEKYIQAPRRDADSDYRSGRLRIEIFLTEEPEAPFPRDKKITLPMSPISTIASSPATSDLMNLGSPMSEFDDSQSVSETFHPKAIGIALPVINQQSVEASTSTDFSRMNIGQSNMASFPMVSQPAGFYSNALPDDMSDLMLAGAAADNLLNLDSGEISSGGMNSGGSAVVVDANGDRELPMDVISQFLNKH